MKRLDRKEVQFMHFTDSEFKALKRRAYSARIFGALATILMVIPALFAEDINWWIVAGASIAIAFMSITARSIFADYRAAQRVRRVSGFYWDLFHNNEDALGIYEARCSPSFERFEVDFVDGYYALTAHLKSGERREYAIYLDGIDDVIGGGLSRQDLNLLEFGIASSIRVSYLLTERARTRFDATPQLIK